MISYNDSLFESLQKEFCPVLDPSLIAALLSDVESGTDVASTDRIEELRATLRVLYLQADEPSRQFINMNNITRDESTSGWVTTDSSADTNERDLSMDYSPSSCSSIISPSPPLEFLQTVMPDVPSAKLKKVLDEHEGEDIWDIIAIITAEEEIQQRGLADQDHEIDWESAHRKKETTGAKMMPKKKMQKKPVLTNIRPKNNLAHQSSHHRNESTAEPPSSQSVYPDVDFWTWTSSISSRLASLLPPHTPATFSSLFHSPRYRSPYDAVRACLMCLCKTNDLLSDQQPALLIYLLDIIVPEDDELDIGLRSRLISDAELALCVTEGRADDALDLVYLLRDLDARVGAEPTIHSRGLLSSPLASSLGNSSWKPPHPMKPNILPPGESSQPSKRSFRKSNAYQWQTVPSRTPTHKSSRHLKSRTPGCHQSNIFDNDKAHDPRIRMRYAMAKSEQALLDAAVMYQRHRSRIGGGEVASFYAERAREWKQIAKRERVNAAREMVLARSEKSGHKEIDLHGTTVAEALVIVREITDENADSIVSGTPLRIITGIGKHSRGSVGVLRPSLLRALTEDGWVVKQWEAGLDIIGKV